MFIPGGGGAFLGAGGSIGFGIGTTLFPSLLCLRSYILTMVELTCILYVWCLVYDTGSGGTCDASAAVQMVWYALYPYAMNLDCTAGECVWEPSLGSAICWTACMAKWLHIAGHGFCFKSSGNLHFTLCNVPACVMFNSETTLPWPLATIRLEARAREPREHHFRSEQADCTYHHMATAPPMYTERLGVLRLRNMYRCRRLLSSF